MAYASNSGITFGDSIMAYGWDLQLSQAVIPMSRNGIGTKGFTGTSPTIVETFAAVSPTRSETCNFIVLNGGVNDHKNFATPIASVKTAAEGLIDDCIALEGIDFVFVWNISPWGNYSGYDAADQAYTDEFNAWLASIAPAKGFILADMYGLLGDTGDPTVLAAEYDSGDGLHPSAAGVRAQRDLMLSLFDVHQVIQENDRVNNNFSCRGAIQPSLFNYGVNDAKSWRGAVQPRHAASVLQGQTIGANYAWDKSGYGLVLLDRSLTASEEAALVGYLNGRAGV